ncbi:MAG: hypothetical protein OEZ36_00400 [Spirochaetota bacterium]|nr:hypothetical protein [Spirochaetota bacterium]
MNEKDLKEFLLAQIDEINRYKWIESEKRCCDIGFQQAAFEWISVYSSTFKQQWIGDGLSDDMPGGNFNGNKNK